VECGLDIFAQTSMAALRAKSLALTDLFITLVETRCAGFPLTLVTPREHAVRGSHVSYEHPNGYAVVQALIARGVIGDYREPRIMRFGFTPLYTSYADVGCRGNSARCTGNRRMAIGPIQRTYAGDLRCRTRINPQHRAAPCKPPRARAGTTHSSISRSR